LEADRVRAQLLDGARAERIAGADHNLELLVQEVRAQLCLRVWCFNAGFACEASARASERKLTSEVDLPTPLTPTITMT
jgi:hypothetical protein